MPRWAPLLAAIDRSTDTGRVYWRRKILTCVLCLNLLLQGVASVVAAPVCPHHDKPQQTTAAELMPASHHMLHDRTMPHAAGDANTAPAAHTHTQHASCDCEQDCAGSCALHAPGKLLPHDLLALAAPHHEAYPRHADEQQSPTVVAPRLRPPTLS